MRGHRLKKLLFLFILATTAAFAQNYTAVSASNFSDSAGNKIARGQICFQAVNATGQSINYQVGGGGQVINASVCGLIVAGVVSMQVANPANTVPAGILYTITANSQMGGTYTCATAAFSGATLNLDTYACPSIVLPPSGGAVNGPVTINGSLTVTGQCIGCGGSGGGGFTRYYPTTSPNGVTTVFIFSGVAGANTKFQLLWNGLLMNETDDYTITIGATTTTVTCVRPPSTGDHLIAYF